MTTDGRQFGGVLTTDADYRINKRLTVVGSVNLGLFEDNRDYTTVTLGYDVPWRKVYQVLIDAAKSTTHLLSEPEPFVLQTSLGDFYVSYELNAFTHNPSIMARIYSELHQNIQDKCNEAGIEILSPHYSAVRDGSQTTIPEDYLPKNYTAPGWRIFPAGNIIDLLNNNPTNPSVNQSKEGKE